MQYIRRSVVVALLLGSAGLVATAQEAAIAEDRMMSQEQLLERGSNARDPVVVLDVRTVDEFAAGHVPGARNVPHDQVEARLAELDELRDLDVVVYCRSGRRTQFALGVLRAHGFTRLWHLEGDFLDWEAKGRQTETEAAEPPVP